MELVEIFVYPLPFKLLRWALNLELVIWSTMVAIGLGLVLKGMWDNYDEAKVVTKRSKLIHAE